MLPRRGVMPPDLPEFMRRGRTPELPWDRPDLLALFDQDDPDIEYVCQSISHLRAAGLDVTDPDILQLAVLGGHRNAAVVEDDASLNGYRREERQRQAREYAEAAARWKESVCHVYYARLGNRCKIGYSLDVPQRMAALQPEELLVTEQGGPILEQQRHREFAAFRTSGEWFSYEGPLVDHVEQLRVRAAERAG